MAMIRKLVPAQVLQTPGLGDDEVEIRMSTGALARDGHILVPQGAELGNYRSNPIILWQHDPGSPVGRAEDLRVDGDAIAARVTFAPAGISATADTTRGLVKSGIINAVSVGFDPIDSEPLDPKRPRGGRRFTRWELLECSFVSVPADPGATVTARAERDARMGDAMEAEGKEKAGTGPGGGKLRSRAAVPHKIRGMYQLGQLAWLFDCLCDAQASSRLEEALEGDEASQLPAMLAAVLQDLGAALIAMAEEEVAELCGPDGDDAADDGAGLDDDAMAMVMAAATPALQRFRIGYQRAMQLRAGKRLSAETMRCLRMAMDAHDEAMALHRSALRCHTRAAQMVGELMDRADSGDDAEDDTQEIQTSDGTDDSTGSEGGRSLDYRRRQAELLALATTPILAG